MSHNQIVFDFPYNYFKEYDFNIFSNMINMGWQDGSSDWVGIFLRHLYNILPKQNRLVPDRR